MYIQYTPENIQYSTECENTKKIITLFHVWRPKATPHVYYIYQSEWCETKSNIKVSEFEFHISTLLQFRSIQKLAILYYILPG